SAAGQRTIPSRPVLRAAISAVSLKMAAIGRHFIGRGRSRTKLDQITCQNRVRAKQAWWPQMLLGALRVPDWETGASKRPRHQRRNH
ncbi:MAG: hypothetical protein WC485_08690, partial [Opitutaceae bacterium]